MRDYFLIVYNIILATLESYAKVNEEQKVFGKESNQKFLV